MSEGITHLVQFTFKKSASKDAIDDVSVENSINSYS
jgi:hypothetical protein